MYHYIILQRIGIRALIELCSTSISSDILCHLPVVDGNIVPEEHLQVYELIFVLLLLYCDYYLLLTQESFSTTPELRPSLNNLAGGDIDRIILTTDRRLHARSELIDPGVPSVRNFREFDSSVTVTGYISFLRHTTSNCNRDQLRDACISHMLVLCTL